MQKSDFHQILDIAALAFILTLKASQIKTKQKLNILLEP